MWESGISHEGGIMSPVVNAYDAKIDNKKRITLRNANFSYYHIQELKDGKIMLEPRVLASLDQVSKKTLNCMDKAMKNYKKGKVSKPIDLSDFGA